MIPGVRGKLVTGTFARDLLPALPGAEPAPPSFQRAIAAWWTRVDESLGPASSVRAIVDVALVPLIRLLGYRVLSRVDAEPYCFVPCDSDGPGTVVALAVAWSQPLSRAWRHAVVHTIASDTRWCFCCNGTTLRIVDGRHTWSREYLEFDLGVLSEDATAQSVLWSVARADAMRAQPPVLDRAALLSARHGVEVCRALGVGVLDALQLLLSALAQRARRYPADVLFEHSLTVLYRVLFLLFAEARGLVPMWHPLYRDRYSIDAIVTALLSGRRYRGLWLAIQAISRLAHAGCAAGELTVTAFNGRLFSPGQSAAFDRTRLDDETLGRAVIAVSTTAASRTDRARIAYRDLDVEQLGAIYEQVLDYQPSTGDAGRSTLVRTGDRRKATGTFYTPRAVTSHLVRQTLGPLIGGRSADEILQLRVLDPAMGSGAFLVAACRYLAAAAEDALIREGRWHAHDITDADRVALRRDVASRCLFGVDANPMAVQLARLSLWLATLSADRPLSFLDHHLVAGDSLVGATPDDVARRPERAAGRRRDSTLPLFDGTDAADTLRVSARVRRQLAAEADDTVAVVRGKERALAALQDPGSPLGRWWRVLDVWCSAWFNERARAPDRGTFSALADRLLHDRRTLPDHVAAPFLAASAQAAAGRRFLHWPLAFPEVFVDGTGNAAAPGFDAIIGNPPWDMVRGDSGDEEVRSNRRQDAKRLTDFVRESGVYRVESRAHANRYQLFVERALQLVRPGGRIGFVLPSGIASDAGAAPLRRHLFDRARVDEITGLDNREGIFPIHRSVRFVLLTCTAGAPTTAIRCRFGISDPQALDRVAPETHPPLVLTRPFLARLSGEEDLGIPELSATADLRIVEGISARVPRLASADGWHALFGRELNASDDRDSFVPFAGNALARPIVEGKQVDPFRVALDRSRHQLEAGRDVSRRAPRRPRLAYRDVASATNRLTLIAAVLPARAVTTHTLFCLKTPLPADAQHVLCALLNSYVANYLVRLRVNTHVTVSLMSRLPVPLVREEGPAFERLAALSRALRTGSAPVEEMHEYAELQALAARLYGLGAADFEHILDTFPLVPAETRTRALRAFTDSNESRHTEARRHEDGN